MFSPIAQITTPQTDNRPSEILDVENFFTYFSALYLLGLYDKDVLIFPNCRVSLPTQVEAVSAAGAYTSIEVKVGSVGYLKSAMSNVIASKRAALLEVVRRRLKTNQDDADLFSRIDQLE